MAPPRPDPEAVLRERPFARIAALERLEPLGEGEGHSGRAFLACAADGRRFKLRVCTSSRRAREIERCMRGLPHVFPQLLARDGRHLLIELLDGVQVSDRKQLRPHARRLGRLCAEIHRLGEPRSPRDRLRARLAAARIRIQLARQLRALRRQGLVDADLERRIRKAWRAWRRRWGVPVSLELHDAHKANFMIDGQGRLRFVDEDGLHYTLRGIGLGKLLADQGARRNLPKRMREWRRFRQGYAELADAGYLTPGYLDGVLMVELVRSIEFKVRREARLFKVDAELAELRELVDRVKPAAGSSDPSGDRHERRDVHP